MHVKLSLMRRRFVVFSLATAMAVALAGCGSPESSKADSKKTELVKFSIATFPGVTYALDAIAEKQGFFRDHGLDVTFLKPQSGSAAAQLLVSGQIQGWATSPAVATPLFAQDKDVKIAGGLNSWAPFDLLVIKGAKWAVPDNASFAQKIQSLKGKRVGVSGVGAVTDLALLAAMKEVGVKEADVTRVGVGATQQALGQLKSGRIDAYVDFTLSGAPLLQKMGVASYYVNLVGEDAPPALQAFSNYSMVANGPYAAKSPEHVKAWIAALHDAYEWLQAHPKEAASLIAEQSYGGKEVDSVQKGVDQLVAAAPKQNKGFKVAPESLQPIVEEMLSIGKIDSSFKMKDYILPHAVQGE